MFMLAFRAKNITDAGLVGALLDKKATHLIAVSRGSESHLMTDRNPFPHHEGKLTELGLIFKRR